MHICLLPGWGLHPPLMGKLSVNRLNHVQLFANLCSVARQAPLSMEFSRQESWSGLPCPPPGDLPDPGIKPKPVQWKCWKYGVLTPGPPKKSLRRCSNEPKCFHVFEGPTIIQFSSVAQSCPTLCDPMNRSTPGLPVHHQLPSFSCQQYSSMILSGGRLGVGSDQRRQNPWKGPE